MKYWPEVRCYKYDIKEMYNICYVTNVKMEYLSGLLNRITSKYSQFYSKYTYR